MTELLNTIRTHIDQQYEGNREKARYDDYYRGMNDGLDKLEQFLDTLPEQPAGEGLEEEARKYLTKNYTPPGDKESLPIEEAAYALWFDDVCHLARHFAEWGRKQVLQEIYEGKVKPVDKITAAWLDDEPNT